VTISLAGDSEYCTLLFVAAKAAPILVTKRPVSKRFQRSCVKAEASVDGLTGDDQCGDDGALLCAALRA
jgi:hypothetical protein